jgi:hypothetical protein
VLAEPDELVSCITRIDHSAVGKGGLPPLIVGSLNYDLKSGASPLPNCEITIVEFIILCSS